MSKLLSASHQELKEALVWYKIYLVAHEILSFFIFLAIFSNGSQQPSWIAQSHKFERTLFADHSVLI